MYDRTRALREVTSRTGPEGPVGDVVEQLVDCGVPHGW